VQFEYAFHCQMRFLPHNLGFNSENDIENACKRETHIQTAHPKQSLLDP
jgi:hypothetical protein